MVRNVTFNTVKAISSEIPESGRGRSRASSHIFIHTLISVVSISYSVLQRSCQYVYLQTSIQLPTKTERVVLAWKYRMTIVLDREALLETHSTLI